MLSPNMDSLGCQPFKVVNWTIVLGLYLRDVIKGLLLVLGSFLIPFWTCVLDLHTYYFKPHQFSHPLFVFESLGSCLDCLVPY